MVEEIFLENVKELKRKTISGFFWGFGERITAQAITFVVSVILARLLSPSEYGMIAIVLIYINIANVFVSSGLGTALVQKKEVDAQDFSSMFWANLVISIFLYFILFFAAPFIARIYQNEALTIIFRVIGLRLPIAAINSIQHAYVSREMIYKKFFWSTLFGTIVSAIVGIVMAYKGFGIWALVGQYLTNSTIDTIVLFFTIHWKPKMYFSFEKFKRLFSFGWKVTLTSLIGTVFDQVRGLIIGLKYSSADLAYNSKGEQIPTLITNNINSSLDTVLLSSVAKIQEDKQKVKQAISRILKLSCFILFPVLLGLAGVSNTLIRILLTDKWLPCLPFLQIMCFQQCFSVVNGINLQVLKAVGRSDISLKLEFMKKPLYLMFIVLAMFISPLAICAANAIYAVVALLINSFPNRKILQYTLWDQVKDMVVSFSLSIITGVIAYAIGYLKINLFVLFVVQVLAGIIVYIGLSLLFNRDNFDYVFALLKNMMRKATKRV